MKSAPHWEKIGLRPHHGICLPLFSLKTYKNPNGGTFLDLLPLIDWCKKVGFDTIQLLPLNDTGRDLSPYNPISSHALHPKYLTPTEEEIPRDKYAQFVDEHPWVITYGRFKALKEKFEGRYWIEWPDQKWDEERVQFHIEVQYRCFSQMERVKRYATQAGIFLQGDVPILISPDSADVWAEPHLFIRNLEAGAPPDYYNSLGQKWGFPLFNWEAMRKDHFRWWKERLHTIEKLFHIYRIDHVVGFFRIWGVQKGQRAAEGSFYPPDEADWYTQGKELLEMMLDSSPLLPIAEDLGTIPKPVYPILKELGICGTKVIRWQVDDERRFIPFTEYERFSLTTVSTHDMTPLESWWMHEPSEAVPFASFMHWAYHPILTQQQRLELLTASHHTTSLFHINLLQEYLALFPTLVWPNPDDERINTPGDLTANNWCYRFRPTLEEITTHQGLEEMIRRILDK